MRRVYSLVLLLALISTPLTAMGAALFSGCGSCCCCSGTMCPMHKKSAQQQGQLGKLCGGGDARSSQQCACGMSACNQQSDLGILATASQAVLGYSVSISVPQQTQESTALLFSAEPYRTVRPPEQPPRL